MKVKDLVQVLNNCDPEMLVLVQGYESGYDDLNLTKIYVDKEHLNDKIDRWWDGKYNDYSNLQDYHSNPNAIVFLRDLNQ